MNTNKMSTLYLESTNNYSKSLINTINQQFGKTIESKSFWGLWNKAPILRTLLCKRPFTQAHTHTAPLCKVTKYSRHVRTRNDIVRSKLGLSCAIRILSLCSLFKSVFHKSQIGIKSGSSCFFKKHMAVKNLKYIVRVVCVRAPARARVCVVFSLLVTTLFSINFNLYL